MATRPITHDPEPWLFPDGSRSDRLNAVAGQFFRGKGEPFYAPRGHEIVPDDEGTKCMSKEPGDD